MTPPVSAPGMGNMAQGLMALKNAVDMIQGALSMLPAGSRQHRDALQAVTRLSRHLPQGTPTAGAQQTSIIDLLRGVARNAVLQKLMSQQGQGGQGAMGGAMGGSPMPGGMPSPPQPSTPLPGA